MAKKMRKLLALVLALVLTVGQVVAPATATEGTDPIVEVSSYVDADTGAQVTVTVTQESSTDAGITTSTTSTTTESSLVQDTTQTDSTQWESITTQTGSDTQPGNPTISTDTNIVTDVKGEETTTVTDTNDGYYEKVSAEINGQETTTVTGTTITTTTEEGVITGDASVTEKTRTEDLKDSTTNTDNGFVGGRENIGQWNDGEIKEGDIVSQTPETSTEIMDNFEHNGDVTLELKPDEKWVSKSWDIGLDDLAKVPAGATVTEKKDKNGNVIGWTVTYQEKVTSSTTPSDSTVTEGTWNPVGQEQSSYVNPGNYSVGTTTEGDDLNVVANGQSVTTKIEEIYVDGVYQGYRIITTTTTKVTGEATDEEVGTRTDASYEKVEGEVLNTGYTMPEVPTTGTTNNEDGTVSTVSYTVIEEDGQPKGYAILTETRDADGKLIRTETRNVYGTEHTSQTTVETDPTAERTTTTTLSTKTEVQEIRTTETAQKMEKVDNRVNTYETTIVKETDTYELIETDAGTFFLYKGKMYEVKAMGNHGEADVDTLTPDIDLITAKEGKDLVNWAENDTGLKDAYNNAANDLFPEGYEFRYVGYGAGSSLSINYGNSSSGTVQFALRDSEGNLHYVYCCDLNTNAKSGTYYEIENLKDAGYYSTAEGNDTVDHIRTVATNGFWATEGDANDIGTLEAVKALLKKYDAYFDADLTAVANSLTEGEALSATQAALWKYGNKGSKPNENNLVYNNNGVHEHNVKALYELLTSDILMKDTTDTSTDLIDKEDIIGSTVTIHGEATNADGSVKTVDGNTVYNTDVSFQLNVEKSSITGNLVVKVVQDGKVIRTEQIVTDDSNWVGQLLAGKESNGSTTYTIEGLELIEGVKFSLNLEGTQDMEEGVYLYTAKGGNSTSQTFVGVASGERDVNLEVDLVFQVSDPKVKHTNKVVTAVREDIQEGTRVSNRTDKKVNTETRNSGNIKTDVSHDIDIVSTVTTTETKQNITKEERKWESYLEYLLEILKGDDGNPDGDDEGGNRRGSTILDEAVPLAAAPRTGDFSGLWASISAVSLAGMAWLGLKRKED